MKKEGLILTPELAWVTGYLTGHLMYAGVQVIPEVDEAGNYTDEINILIRNTDHHLPDIEVVTKVVGWSER